MPAIGAHAGLSTADPGIALWSWSCLTAVRHSGLAEIRTPSRVTLIKGSIVCTRVLL